MKKIIAFLLALVMVIGLSAAPAYADDPNSTNHLAYSCLTQAGDQKSVTFCEWVTWERATNTDVAGDYRVLNTQLVATSNYSDANTGYGGMKNINYRATETTGFERYHSLMGSTTTHTWTESSNYKCFECNHKIVFDIVWNGYWDDNNQVLSIHLD